MSNYFRQEQFDILYQRLRERKVKGNCRDVSWLEAYVEELEDICDNLSSESQDILEVIRRNDRALSQYDSDRSWYGCDCGTKSIYEAYEEYRQLDY